VSSRGGPHFLIVPPVRKVSTIAAGRSIRELRRLVRTYGRGRWLKRKGEAHVQLMSGRLIQAEIHWYEAAGIGQREHKIKRIIP